MRLGYNTNGLAHHRLLDAIDLLADQGYQSVAITLDAGALDPYEDPRDPESTGQRGPVCPRSARHGPGDRDRGALLLNPRMKHDPTLMDPDPRAAPSGSTSFAAPSTWPKSSRPNASRSGPDTLPIPSTMRRAWTGSSRHLKPVLDHAEQAGMTLAFEPEPGMFIDTLDRFAQLDERLRHPLFQLTIDLGHVHCMDEGDIPSLLDHWRTRIVNIHIEDMVRGVHEHLMFGQGTMDFASICRALRQIGYEKGVHVELSRHSHMAVEAVRAAMAFLDPLIGSAQQRPIAALDRE